MSRNYETTKLEEVHKVEEKRRWSKMHHEDVELKDEDVKKTRNPDNLRNTQASTNKEIQMPNDGNERCKKEESTETNEKIKKLQIEEEQKKQDELDKAGETKNIREELRKTEEKLRKLKEMRKLEEENNRQEELRKTEEKFSKHEEQINAEEEKKRQEELRKTEEREKRLDELKMTDEKICKLEELRKQEELRKLEEEKNRQKELRQAEEECRKSEEQINTEEEKKRREELKMTEEREKRLEELRIAKEKIRELEELRKQEELRKLEEEKNRQKELRQAEEECRKSEEQINTEEEKKRREELKTTEEREKRLEELRIAKEKIRELEELRKQEELRKLEEEKNRQEELRQAEEKIRKLEELRKVETQRRKHEENIKAEEEKKRQEELKKAEEEEKRVEELRKTAEANRKREQEGRLRQEELRKNREERRKQEERKRKIAQKKQNVSLRFEVQMWLQSGGNAMNVEHQIQNLALLRTKYQSLEKQWLHDVIYVRGVQKALTWTVQHMRDNKTEKRLKHNLANLLARILTPYATIQVCLFPNLREVIESIDICNGPDIEPFEVKNMASLLKVLEKYVVSIRETSKEFKLKSVQQRLESTMRAESNRKVKRHDFLICVGVLQLFGFKLKTFVFEEHLCEKDLFNICSMLEKYFSTFNSVTTNKQKQAYILNIALHGMEHKQATVQYMIENMPGGVCAELREAFKVSCSANDTFDFKLFQVEVQKLLKESLRMPDLFSLLCSLKSQLHFLQAPEKGSFPALDYSAYLPAKPVEKILDALDMKQYYPQKLRYEDVIQLTPDVNDVTMKPKSLPELPWYFMKHIIGLDSSTRENCHVFESRFNESDDDSQDESDDTITSVHPLDMIYVIFLCADDFLRQELTDKMSRCQYGVPFILPQYDYGQQQPRHLILHWALKSISRNFYFDKKVVNNTVVDLEVPLVSCMSLGEETSWKSRLMNKMLSPQQETFWHQGLKGGDYKQRVSQGMVEVAWYLPGRHDNTFEYPVTFANMRQSAEKAEDICHRLHNSSSVTCVFVDNTSTELFTFLEGSKASKALNKVIVIILHKKENRNIKKQSNDLQKTFDLERHQVIRKAAEDVNFNTVYEQLKKSIEEIIKKDR